MTLRTHGPEANAPRRPRSVLALLSVVLAVIGFLSILAAVVAIVCALAAKHRAKRIAPGERGAGLATWGLVLGALAFVWQVVFWSLVIAGVIDVDDVFGWPFR